MPGARDRPRPRRGPSLSLSSDHQTRLCDETAVSEDDEDNKDNKESVGLLSHVNRAGFPMDAVTWERMWWIAARQHPGGSDVTCSIRRASQLPKVQTPSVPNFLPSTPIPEKLEAIQKFMCELQYNHTGTQFYEIKKCRPFSGLMDLAKEMIRESLPIKCLEAVVLAIYLTNGLQGVERFPLAFRTRFGGTIFGHVVLGMWSSGKYGALGMSRRPDLMHRSLTFNNLTDLVADFGKAYATYWHEVVNLKLGLFLPHNPYSFEQLDWNYLVLNVTKLPPADLHKELEKHARDMKLLKGVAVQGSPNKECKKGTSSPNHSPKRTSTQSQRKISYGDKLSAQGERNKETTSQPPDPYKIRV